MVTWGELGSSGSRLDKTGSLKVRQSLAGHLRGRLWAGSGRAPAGGARQGACRRNQAGRPQAGPGRAPAGGTRQGACRRVHAESYEVRCITHLSGQEDFSL